MSYNIEGNIYDAESCSPVNEVQVVHSDGYGNTLDDTVTNESGYWCLKKEYTDGYITFTHPNFVSKTYNINEVPSFIRLLESKIIGYQKKLWFLPGEQVDVFVNSTQDYTVNLCRHGFEKENILSLGTYFAQTQSVPDDFFVDKGLDWNRSFQYTIPQNAKPGLYSLLLKTNDEEPFAIPMIVSTPRYQHGKQSKILVLASTNTWQSYNLWGGRSRYRNYEDGYSRDFIEMPSTKNKMKKALASRLSSKQVALLKRILRKNDNTPLWVFKKLTIHRPFTNCNLEDCNVFQPFTNHLARGEWCLLAWLERENIDYDIISGAELHWNPDVLKHYSAVIFSTHCEYWSGQMYESVKYYHENNGLWLLNISGNTMFREIEFFEDGSTRCISLSFANSYADESQLLGVRFSMDDYSTCAPYKIIQPNHWVFSNIPINEESLTFGGLSLNQNTPKQFSRYDPGRPGFENGLVGMGASGWETDKLTKTAPEDMKVIAKGMNKKGGADMIIREPYGNRGGMFSASSLIFSGCLLIDNTASMVVKNVIEKASDN